MRIIGNILWFIFGGGMSAIAWGFAALLMAISIIGLPWARASLNIAKYSLLPFGSRLVDRRAIKGKTDLGTGTFGLLGNIIWFIFGGWYLALMHLFFGCLWTITIIGIPFGVAHFRLMRASIFPVGKAVVPSDVARNL